MLKVEVLDYLYRVYRFNSIQLAAESIPVAPSTISSALHKLEKDWGITLLNRTYRGIELTESAQVIAKASVPLFMEMEKLEKIIAKEQGIFEPQRAEKLTLFLPRGWWRGSAAQIFTYFQENNIDVILPDLLYTNEEYLRIIDKDKYAVLCNFFTEPAEDSFTGHPHIRFFKIFSSKPCIIAAANSTLVPAKIKEISLKEAARLPFLRYTEGIDQGLPIFNLLSKHGQLNIVHEVSNVSLLVSMIKCNKGVGLGTKSTLGYTSDMLQFIPIRTDFRLSLLLCYHETLPEKLVDSLRQMHKELIEYQR